MLIIVEGADGVGKTSLINRIAESIHAEVLHRGPLKRDPIDEYARDIQHYRPGRGRTILCDRWHLGEKLYGPLLRGESRLTREVEAHVEKVLQARGALMIVLTDKVEDVKYRLGARGDDLITSSHLDQLVPGYERAAIDSALVNVLHSGIPTAKTVAHWMRTASALELGAEHYLGGFTTYVGPPRPQFLLVGEKRHGEPPYPDEAAFTPGNVNSGRFLLGALSKRVLRYSGLINALEDDVAAFLQRQNHRIPVVALGRSAERNLRENGVECSSVPHPQYVRRFHHRAQAEYGSLIEQVLDDGPRNELSWRPST